MRPLLETLHGAHGVSTVLVEAGGGLVGALAAENLVDDALVFTAPLLLGDASGVAPLRLPGPDPIDRAARRATGRVDARRGSRRMAALRAIVRAARRDRIVRAVDRR